MRFNLLTEGRCPVNIIFRTHEVSARLHGYLFVKLLFEVRLVSFRLNHRLEFRLLLLSRLFMHKFDRNIIEISKMLFIASITLDFLLNNVIFFYDVIETGQSLLT